MEVGMVGAFNCDNVQLSLLFSLSLAHSHSVSVESTV